MCVCVCVCVFECTRAQLSSTLCYPMDCGPPDSSVHGIFQARILEWASIGYSRGSSQPRDRTMSLASPAMQAILYHCAAWEAPSEEAVRSISWMCLKGKADQICQWTGCAE